MDAVPLGNNLIQARSCVFLMKEEKIGIKNSKENATRLAINRFLAIFEFQEKATAPIAEITKTIPMQSKISEISENQRFRMIQEHLLDNWNKPYQAKFHQKTQQLSMYIVQQIESGIYHSFLDSNRRGYICPNALMMDFLDCKIDKEK